MVSSCEKLPLIVNIPAELVAGSFDIPKTDTTGEAVTEKQVVCNIDSLLKANNTSKDKIESIKVRAYLLKIIEPASQNFGVIKSVKLELKTDGGQYVTVASQTDIPTTAGFDFAVVGPDQDLKEYFLGNSINYRVTVENREKITQTLGVNAIFNVDFKIKP